MNPRLNMIIGLLSGMIPVTMIAQAAPPANEVGGSMLAIVTDPPKSSTELTVKSPAFTSGGDIPFENTQYKANKFPGFSWNAGPTGTKSYVIIMQDGDALRAGAPILHWTMINIPATITKLDPGMTAPPTGAQNGPNMRGAAQTYLGPRTPAGPKHRYHIQVFAMNNVISAGSAATYAGLVAAMMDHVLASGQLIGLGQVAPQE